MTLADSVETLGVEKKKVQGEVLDYQEEQSLWEELHESGCQEVAACGHDASKDLGESKQWRWLPRRS